MTESEAIDDKSLFIKTCFQNLFVFQVMDAFEFVVVSRALPKLMKENRDIVLLVIDGLHQFEMNDIMQEEKEEQIFGEIPDAGNFFNEDTNDVIMREETNPKKKAH